MKLAVIAAALSLAAFSANADDRLIRFDGAIGSQPLRAGGLVNDVRGVAPGGRPWVISSLRVDIRTDGRISEDGRGLLIGGGDTVASNANQSVKATLICTTATPPAVPPLIDSIVVPLEANGDFRIEDEIKLPAECPSPVLLIRNAGGAWFAAGIPKL